MRVMVFVCVLNKLPEGEVGTVSSKLPEMCKRLLGARTIHSGQLKRMRN